MQDSTTYQAILREGRNEGMAKGRPKACREERSRKPGGSYCGWVENGSESPDPETQARIDAMIDLVEIEELADRLLDVSSWDELMVES